MFLLLVHFLKSKLISLAKGNSASEPLCDAVTRLRLLLGYHNYYAIHGIPYMSVHVLIENTLVQHKMIKISRMALCCQNRV